MGNLKDLENELSSTDYIFAMTGGLVICLSSCLYFYTLGRPKAMSSLMDGLTYPTNTSHWNISLFCGVVLSSSIWFLVYSYDAVQDSYKLFDHPLVQI